VDTHHLVAEAGEVQRILPGAAARVQDAAPHRTALAKRDEARLGAANVPGRGARVVHVVEVAHRFASSWIPLDRFLVSCAPEGAEAQPVKEGKEQVGPRPRPRRYLICGNHGACVRTGRRAQCPDEHRSRRIEREPFGRAPTARSAEPHATSAMLDTWPLI